MEKTVNPDGITYGSHPDPFTGQTVPTITFWYTLKAGKSYVVFYSMDAIRWLGGMVFTARPGDHRHPETFEAGSPTWPKIIEN